MEKKKKADLHDIFVALLPSSGGFTPFRKLNVEAKAHKKTGVTPHMPLFGKMKMFSSQFCRALTIGLCIQYKNTFNKLHLGT